jgi:hypothetical protein
MTHNACHHPARASKGTMSKTADPVLGVHGFVRSGLSTQDFSSEHQARLIGSLSSSSQRSTSALRPQVLPSSRASTFATWRISQRSQDALTAMMVRNSGQEERLLQGRENAIQFA